MRRLPRLRAISCCEHCRIRTCSACTLCLCPCPSTLLQHAGVPIEHLYFVEEGLVSVLAKTDERNAVEVWSIGREGAVGSTVALGIKTSTLSHFVQIGGSALRIGVQDLNRAMSEIPSLRAVLHGYLHSTLVQSSQSAACSLRHSLLQRLARWLLTAQDRSDMDALPITQDLLARSLGVRRPTVSEAFRVLEHRGIFGRERGLIRILDRGSLEQIACHCYRAMCLRRDRPERAEMRTTTRTRGALLRSTTPMEGVVRASAEYLRRRSSRSTPAPVW